MTFKHFLVIGLFSVLAAILLLILFNSSGSPFPGGAIAVDADELLKAYQLDSRDADRRFRDKQVAVTGTITQMQDSWIAMTPHHEVVCNFSEDNRDSLKELRIGDLVTVRGRCEGFDPRHRQELDIVMVHDCRLLTKGR
jgi:hypothetical protein